MSGTPLRDKLAFGSPDLAITLLFATVNGWLLYYLVTVINLPPLWAGAIFVAGRICDGLLDPFIGSWTDRYGRKRAIAIGLPIAASAFVAIWAAPLGFDSTTARLIATASAFFVFTFGYTCVSVPRLGMLPAFAPTYNARSAQVAIDMAFVFFALLLASTAFPAVVGARHGGLLAESKAITWVGAAVGVAVISVMAYLPFLIRISQPRQTPVSVSVWTAFASISETKNAGATLGAFASSVIALVSLQSTLPFWMEAQLGLQATEQAYFLGAVFSATLLSLWSWATVCQRRGKAYALGCAALLYLAALVAAAVVPVNSGMSAHLIAAGLIAGAATGGLSVAPWAMIPDIAAEHAARFDQAIEGTATAAFTMTNKASAAVAIFGASGLLAMNLAPTTLLALPAIAGLVVLFFVYILKETDTGPSDLDIASQHPRNDP